MMVFRAVQERDLSDVYALALQASAGVTTLPADEAALKYKLECSLASFAGEGAEERLYWFVLEETLLQKVVGVAAIVPKVGEILPSYTFKLGLLHQCSQVLQQHQTHKVLFLVNDYQGKTEICTLFLSPDFRKHGNGSLLSRGRFLFMAQFPHLFSDLVFAEMRGISSAQGESPFWEAVGRHFFCMDFVRADRLSATTDKQFISDLMPRFPIYADLLPEAAQRVIGKPHHETKPALKMLEREGFSSKGYVDIFDAGPTVEASLPLIKTIQESQLVRVAEINDRIHTVQRYLFANTQIAMRACMGRLASCGLHQVRITSDVAAVLKVQEGDTIRVAPL